MSEPVHWKPNAVVASHSVAEDLSNDGHGFIAGRIPIETRFSVFPVQQKLLSVLSVSSINGKSSQGHGIPLPQFRVPGASSKD
jgi:hypothetical protein